MLGAGYAGVRLVHAVDRLARGRWPIVLVDRHPWHVLRTELYEVGELARRAAPGRRFTVAIDRVLAGAGARFQEGEVGSIDLPARTVTVGGNALRFGSLAICLGSVPAYYGIPGAAAHLHHVYRFRSAETLGAALRAAEEASAGEAATDRPRVVVVGGGSTGTEVAAEIATVDWTRVAGQPVPRPRVTLVTGAVPLLAGLPEGLIHHARDLLGHAGVDLLEGHNVRSVDARALTLDDGRALPFDVGVWAAGIQAPEIVRGLPVDHGRGGRIAAGPTLEVPGWPGVFGVGDVVEVADAVTGAPIPATAQAAIAEAEVAARNLVARRQGRPLAPFVYRERGTIVSVGRRAASAALRHVTIWGAPAKVLKAAVEREYAVAAARPGHRRRAVKGRRG